VRVQGNLNAHEFGLPIFKPRRAANEFFTARRISGPSSIAIDGPEVCRTVERW
jgi:hypothetical protein